MATDTQNATRHPIQPLHTVGGVVRFKENEIVRFLLDAGPFDLNQIAVMTFSQDDREQFAQLIGYSLSGFGELSYVSDETYAAAEEMMSSTGTDANEARIASLEAKLEGIKVSLREPIAQLYGIHPDDLLGGGTMSDTQNARILRLLKGGVRLDPMEALMMCQCFRLSARIYDLRRQGHKIESKIVRSGNKNYAVYWMEKISAGGK